VNKKELRIFNLNKKGSIVIQVLSTISMLLLVLHAYFYINFLEKRQIKERLLYEQNFRLTQGAMNFAIKYIKQKYPIVKKIPLTELKLIDYAKILNKNYNVKIIFLSDNEKIKIKAVALLKDKKVCELSAVAKKIEDSVRISQWEFIK